MMTLSSSQLIYSLAVVGLLFATAEAQCTASNTQDWVAIPDDEFNRTYSKITDTDARPLGYKVATYNYNKGTSVCVRVPDTSGKAVTVEIETEPAAKLCVKYPSNGDNTDCVESKTYGFCNVFISQPDGSTTFEFYCNGECSESDVNFWFRFRVCSCANDDDNEKFCLNVGGDFPSSLLKSVVIPPEPKPVPPASRALTVSICSFFLFALSIIHFLF